MTHLSLALRSVRGGRVVRGDFRPNQSQGNGRITGTVEIYGTPANTLVRRRVRLYRELDGALLREVWSDAVTGTYVLNYVDPAGFYTLITYDYTHNMRAVAADRICLANGTLELMP